MPDRNTSEPETARILGVTTKTLQRYRGRGCPYDSAGGVLSYDPAEVRSWQVSVGLAAGPNQQPAAPPPAPTQAPQPASPAPSPVRDEPPPVAGSPPGEAPALKKPRALRPPVVSDPIPMLPPSVADAAVFADVASRQKIRKLDEAAKGVKVQQLAHELQVEKGLPDLGLGAKVRSAKTLEENGDLAGEIAALMADGKLPHTLGRALREMVTERRHNIRQALKASENGAVSFERAFMCQNGQTADVVRLFEGIVSETHRARAFKVLSAIAEEDALTGPKADTGAPDQDAGA